MPYIETVGELADTLADLIGVYGVHDEEAECPDDPRRMCRACVTSVMTGRIRTAAQNERRLDALGAFDKEER